MEKQNHIDYDLIAKVISGNATAQERDQIVVWREASESNAELYASLELLWTDSKIEKPLAEQFDTNKAWDKVAQQTVYKSVRRFYLQPILRIAAILLLIAGATFWLLRTDSGQGQYAHTNTSDTLEQAMLFDSSVMVLNSNSHVELDPDFGQEERVVNLKKGNVYFQVKRDSTKPFIVRTKHLEITVLGTAFDVNTSHPDSTVVTVTSGIVDVAFMKEKLLLRKGEQAVLYHKTKKLIKRNMPVDVHQYWKGILLDFRGKKLRDVFNELEKMYGLKFKANESILKKKIHVRFDNEDPGTILDIIGMTLDLEMNEQEGVYEVKAKDDE